MFGTPRRGGMFGNRNMQMGSGLVATPEQQAETARLTGLLGAGGMTAPDQRGPFGMPDPVQGQPQPDFMGGQGGVQPAPQPQQPRDPYAPATGSRRVVGILGDFLSGMAGGPANFANAQNQLGQERRAVMRQQQLAELQQENERQTYAARQAAEQAQWVARQQYERANPAPQAPNEFERAMAAAGIAAGTPEYAEMSRRRAESIANPMQYLPNGDGTFTVVPRGGVAPQRPQMAPTDGERLPIGTRVQSLPPAQGGPIAPASSQSGGGRMTSAQQDQMIRAMGRPAYEAWQRQHRVQVVN